jgi:hypothetical protein
MSDVVLAVPERALAVLPGLPPENGREAHQEGTLGERARQRGPDGWRNLCTTFQAMLPRSVVEDTGTLVEAVDGWQNCVSLRGV